VLRLERGLNQLFGLALHFGFETGREPDRRMVLAGCRPTYVVLLSWSRLPHCPLNANPCGRGS
jgi:hypothetical protein